MRATLVTAALCAALACSIGDVSAPVSSYVLLDPVLDSLIVGDDRPLPSVTYFDGRGNSRTPSPSEIHWQSSDTTILLRVTSSGIRMLSIPRDLKIDNIPGHGGPWKMNAWCTRADRSAAWSTPTAAC